MSTQTGITIQNVATLDLRRATPAALANIQRIENAATVLYSAETAELVTSLAIGNVASLIKVAPDAKVITGSERMGHGAFADHGAPVDLVVAGQLIIEPNVTAEELTAGLKQLLVYGQMLYPDHLAGVVQSKLVEVNGQRMSYGAKAKIIMGKLELTEILLRGLDDETEFLVFGKVSATQILPNELLAQKMKKLEVFGKLICHEENAPILLGRTTGVQVTIIPSGFAYLDKPLVLDAATVEALPSKKLYGTSIRIEPDVTAAALEAALDTLILSDQLIAPSALRTVIGSKVDLLNTQTIFYEGELWLVENEMTLLPERFDYLEGKATVVVYGDLLIDPSVEPKQLAQQFHKVYNWGAIHCSKAQLGALQARLAINEGEFVYETETPATTNANVIGNAAYLAL